MIVPSLKGAMPDIDDLLAAAVNGTDLLKGNNIDYLLALLIAVAFPIVRWILDRTLYDVRYHLEASRPRSFYLYLIRMIQYRFLAVECPQNAWISRLQEVR